MIAPTIRIANLGAGDPASRARSRSTSSPRSTRTSGRATRSSARYIDHQPPGRLGRPDAGGDRSATPTSIPPANVITHDPRRRSRCRPRRDLLPGRRDRPDHTIKQTYAPNPALRDVRCTVGPRDPLLPAGDLLVDTDGADPGLPAPPSSSDRADDRGTTTLPSTRPTVDVHAGRPPATARRSPTAVRPAAADAEATRPIRARPRRSPSDATGGPASARPGRPPRGGAARPRPAGRVGSLDPGGGRPLQSGLVGRTARRVLSHSDPHRLNSPHDPSLRQPARQRRLRRRGLPRRRQAAPGQPPGQPLPPPGAPRQVRQRRGPALERQRGAGPDLRARRLPPRPGQDPGLPGGLAGHPLAHRGGRPATRSSPRTSCPRARRTSPSSPPGSASCSSASATPTSGPWPSAS